MAKGNSFNVWNLLRSMAARRKHTRKVPRLIPSIRRKMYGSKRSKNSYSNHSPIQNSKVVTLRAAYTVSLDPTATPATALAVFNANGAFDPYAPVTRQPLGFDEWSNFYNNYNVLSSKISATFMSTTNGGSSGNGIVGIILNDDSQVINTAALAHALVQLPKCKYAYIASSDGGKGVTTVRQYYSTRKYFGTKDVDDDQYEGVTGDLPSDGSNPSKIANFTLFATPQDETSDMVACIATVIIDYKIKFSTPKVLNSS